MTARRGTHEGVRIGVRILHLTYEGRPNKGGR
jgi:hypothetical protein